MNKIIYELPVFLAHHEIRRELRVFLDSIADHQLEGFRNLYSSDYDTFFSVVNEMILRGFKFNINNHLFPNVNFDSSDYIECNDFEGERFKRIHFSVIGLGMILKDYNIKNDGFFHKIPLDGFTYFNPQVDVEYVKELFQKEGFIIKNNVNTVNNDSCNDNCLINTVYSELKYNTFKSFCELHGYVYMKDLNETILNRLSMVDGFRSEEINDILKKYEQWLTNAYKGDERKMKSSIDYPVHRMELKKVFSENKYNKFISFCSLCNVVYVSEINEKLLDTFASQLGVGSKKIDDIRKVLKQLSKNDYQILEKRNINYSNSNVSIKRLFYDNKYNKFLRFCSIRNLVHVSDLNDGLLEEFASQPGIGRKKYDDVIKVLEQLSETENNADYSNFKIKIESVFSDMKYDRFVNFCRKYNIIYVSDLKENLLTEFSLQPGVGRKKMMAIRNMLLELGELNNDESGFFSIEQYDELQSFDLSINEYFNLFNIEATTSSELYLEDIINKKYIDLVDVCSIEDLKSLNYYLNKYNDVELMFNEIVEKSVQSENQRIVMQYRLCGDKTLEEVGNKLNITRERVRQIEQKLIKIISAQLNHIMFYSYLKLLLWDKQIIKPKDITELFSRYTEVLIRIINEGMTSMFWNKKFNYYSFDDLQIPEPPILNEEWDYCLTVDVISQCAEYWSDIIDDLNEDKIKEILSEVYKLYFYGEIVSKGHLSKTKCIEVLIRYYYADGIRFDATGCVDIRKKALEKLEYNLNEIGDRSLEAKARSNGNLILIDSKMFKYFYESNELLILEQKVENYLDRYFEKYDQIFSKDLNAPFRQECNENGLYSDIGLYSLIKRYCQDKYNFSTGNERVIHKSICSRIPRDEQLCKLFSSKEPVLTKSEILEELPWVTTKLDQTISSSKLFIIGSSSKVYCKKYITLEDEDKNIFIKTYNRCKENGYCHLNKLYYELKFDLSFNKLFKKYHIDNGIDLRVLIPEEMNVRSWHYLTFSEDCKGKNIMDVLTIKFPDVVSREDIVEYLKENKYDSRQIIHIFSSLDASDKFISTDRDCYVNSNAFEISQDVVDKLIEYIGDHEYILLNSLRGYRKCLPKIAFKWTPTLMAEILSRNGYRIIMRKNRDYRIDYSIVVKETSGIKSLSDLVYKILRFEYNGKHDVQSVIDYLNERKVFNNEKIPYEILKDDRFTLDEFQILHWRD